MKLLLLIFTVLMNYSLSVAASAPKKGVKMSAEVREAIQEMAKQYGKGNLPQLLRKRAGLLKSSVEFSIPQEFKFPVIAGNFSDTSSDRYPVENLQKELFDGPWPTGTMKEMYLEQSYGQFLADGTVHGWFDLNQTEAWYTNGSNGLGADGRAANFVKELVAISDDSVDYGLYDNDNDGWVEAVIIVHAGYGGETGGDGIWSHRWSLNESGLGFYTTNDTNALGIRVKVDDYSIQPALSGSSGNKMIEIGIFCHEFGHVLGLPDLYDTDDS